MANSEGNAPECAGPRRRLTSGTTVRYVEKRDWFEWHQPLDDPKSPLSRRLAAVQHHLRVELDRCPTGPIRVVSICAGQGRDLLSVVADHPRREDVSARLVELDPRNVAFARAYVADQDLDSIEIVEVDAGLTDAYVGAVPAEIVLACGVFGNITADDISRTVQALPGMCVEGAAVIWTRNRIPPDLTPRIRTWFRQAGFAEQAFEVPEGTFFGVGVNRLTEEPPAFSPGHRLFTFVGYDHLLGKSQ